MTGNEMYKSRCFNTSVQSHYWIISSNYLQWCNTTRNSAGIQSNTCSWCKLYHDSILRRNLPVVKFSRWYQFCHLFPQRIIKKIRRRTVTQPFITLSLHKYTFNHTHLWNYHWYNLLSLEANYCFSAHPTPTRSIRRVFQHWCHGAVPVRKWWHIR